MAYWNLLYSTFMAENICVISLTRDSLERPQFPSMFDLSENTGSTKSSTEAVQLILWSLLSSSLASAPLNLAAPYPCGSLRGGRSARVIGGNMSAWLAELLSSPGSSASAGQFPWAVRLRNAKTNNLVGAHVAFSPCCAGSLRRLPDHSSARADGGPLREVHLAGRLAGHRRRATCRHRWTD